MAQGEELLRQVASDLKNVDPQIAEAEKLIAVMRAAGENTTQLESRLRGLRDKRDKWKRAMADRGYNVGS